MHTKNSWRTLNRTPVLWSKFLQSKRSSFELAGPGKLYYLLYHLLRVLYRLGNYKNFCKYEFNYFFKSKIEKFISPLTLILYMLYKIGSVYITNLGRAISNNTKWKSRVGIFAGQNALPKDRERVKTV